MIHSLCAHFRPEYRSALDLLGTKSGRDGDKIRESGLTVVASQFVASPAFAEAELILECKKNYWTDLDPSHFLDGRIEKNYPLKDYHRIYFGLVKGVFGLESFRSKIIAHTGKIISGIYYRKNAVQSLMIQGLLHNLY